MATLKILPASLDIELFKGVTMDVTLTYNDIDPDTGEVLGPVDLTGWSAEMTIKSANLVTTYDTLTDTNGRIVLGGEDGTIRFISSASAVAAYSFTTAVINLELTDTGGKVSPVVNGTLTLKTTL